MPASRAAADPSATEPRKVLVIDPSGEARDFLRYCSARAWSRLVIVPYNFSLGPPRADFDWSGFDLVVLEQQLNAPDQKGVAWLLEIRRCERAPPVIMLIGALTDDLRRQAKLAGAAAVLGKDEISSSVFIQCVKRILGGSPSTGDTALLPMPPAVKEDPAPSQVPAALRPHVAPTLGMKEVYPEVPGYRIQRLLARGNVASVYLARGSSDAELIALKLMRLDGQGDSSILKRFMQEYQVIARLEHTNIVRIFERGFGNDFAFIAMEYCQGGDLKERIKQGVSAPQALAYLRQIMLALGAAHAIGIVHRDLKPANVLLRDPHSVVITDFGIAKDIESDLRLTGAKSILGSLYYVSPESIRDDKLDRRSDLYSAGALLYQMLTGVPPFKAATVSRMLEAHLSTPIPRLPQELAPLQPLVDGLLAKNPEDRFQSTEDVIGGIDWIANSQNWAGLADDSTATGAGH